MTKHSTALSSIEASIDRKEEEVLAQRGEVLAFLETEHETEHSKAYLTAVRKSEAEINTLLLSLHVFKARAEFKNAAEQLCAKCRDLEIYTRDMRQCLSEDLAELRAKDKIDLIKVGTFIVGFPIMFLTLAKNAFGSDAVDTACWTGVGLGLGGGLTFHKKIRHAWRASSEAACRASRPIKDSFFLYCVRNAIEEKSQNAKNVFRGTGKVFAQSFVCPSKAAERTAVKSSQQQPPSP